MDLAMERINGSTWAVKEWDEWEREEQEVQRARSRSVADFRSGSELGGHWESLDEVFPSQPRRFALSKATHRERTQKAPRGPTLRGPRTWMRHRAEGPALPSPVEELDRYYTEAQNPIGRSAGTGKFRSNSERVVLAISQPPLTKWRDDQAGPAPSKSTQGTLLLLKVSSGSVSNWRQVKESGSTNRERSSGAAGNGFSPAAAHLKMPEASSQEEAPESFEQDRDRSPEAQTRTRQSPTISFHDPPQPARMSAASPGATGSLSRAANMSNSSEELQQSAANRRASTTARKNLGLRGYVGTHSQTYSLQSVLT